jgi:hypothetical protein
MPDLSVSIMTIGSSTAITKVCHVGSEAVFSGRTGSSVTSSIELLHAIVTL